MGVRDYIYSLITTDPVLNGLGVTADSTFTSHTVDTPQIRPLCILRWQATNAGLGPINQRTLQVWVHDSVRTGSYVTIDETLRRVRGLLTSVEGVNVGGDAAWLSGINWEGDSDDLRDDELGTLMRNSQYRLTGSAL